MKKRSIAFLSALLLMLIMASSAFAQEQSYTRNSPFEGEYLNDSYGLLTGEEQQAIETMAAEASEKHGCGIYLLIVEDYRQLAKYNKIFKVNYTYYHQHELGMGEDRDGILLLLSMKERDFSFFVYGDRAEYALNPWGQKRLEEHFLPHLRANRWYDGAAAFVSCCDEFFGLAEQGQPVRRSALGGIIISAVIALLTGIVYLCLQFGKHKRPAERGEALSYVSKGLSVTLSEDVFYDSTVEKLYGSCDTFCNDDDSFASSSKAHVGGGGSGRSGKF